ncbi:MAG: hypothetical protein D6808_00370 [Candidatus Dadabacteria bacterium]|nr:MAG: hypothetical protein D6808_00370 [Candidatus Dadabacteria bacterium]
MKLRTTLMVIFSACGILSCSQYNISNNDPNISRGEALFRSRCIMCHDLPHPKRHYSYQWPNLVEIMQKRMIEKGLPPLTETERSAIISYLKVNSRNN